MTDLAQPSGRFREVALGALHGQRTQAALALGTARLREARLEAWDEIDGIEELRARGHEIRMRVIDDLDRYLVEFADAVEASGGRVFRAQTAEEASAYVATVCRDLGARLVAKSKSMLSEEIGLNDALAAVGVRAVETDLGEYLQQLAGEPPVHIVAPSIEKTIDDVAGLLGGVDGRRVERDPGAVSAAARRQLQEVFLGADVGVTGANFAVCETGSICLCTNEGNARLVTSLPRVHVALVGIERLVPTLGDLAVLLRLLARSANGQQITNYTTFVTGPRRPGERDGPEELHVVLVDNGRSNLRRGRYREMLACIRCGSCLNVCPVYRKAGGSAYGSVYSGPMGAVLVPLLVGLERAPALPHASSLCGACTEACPVGIPLHELLLDLRADLVGERVASRSERLAFTAWSYAWSSVLGYRVSTALGRRLAPLGRRLWAGRSLPRLGRRYRDRAGSSRGRGRPA